METNKAASVASHELHAHSPIKDNSHGCVSCAFRQPKTTTSYFAVLKAVKYDQDNYVQLQ